MRIPPDPSRSPSLLALLARPLAIALVLAVLPVLFLLPSASAAYARLFEPRQTPIAGAPFTLNGIITSDMHRPVRLQRVSASGKTTTIAVSTATKSGTFTFAGVRLSGSATLQAVAPRFKGDLAHPKPHVATAAIQVQVVRQAGSLAALPPIVQQGPAPSPPSETGQVVASFVPARAGRRVHLQEKAKGDWRTVQRAVQDRGGFAAFSVPPGRAYRAVTQAAQKVPAVTTAAVRSRTWKTTFEDTFSGDTLDMGTWSDRQPDGTEAQGIRTCARVDPSTRSVSGGTLQLGIGLDPQRAGETCSYTTARYGPGVSPYLVNSQIDSRFGFRFTHGFAAARIKWQQPKGMHGGFWMQPSNGKTAGRPDLGTEVDVVEHFGQGSLKGGVGAFVHYFDQSGVSVPLAADHEPTALLKPRGDTWWSSYHVFSVEWTAEQYVFRVDGREFWRESRAVSNVDEYILLSMLTSDYELRDLAPEELSATASVDWVRVWHG